MDFDVRNPQIRSISVEQTKTSEDSSVADQVQEPTNPDAAAVRDSIETGNQDSIFSVDITTGQLNFGDAAEGSKPSESRSNVQATYGSGLGQEGNAGFAELFEQSKIQIKNYLSSQSIDTQMQEVKEKADLAMQQVNAGLVIGIVAGAMTVSGVFSSMQAYADQVKNELVPKLDSVSKLQLESRHESLSTVLRQQANKNEIQSENLQKQAEAADDSMKASEDHGSRMRDAILDFLRKLSEMNPQI